MKNVLLIGATGFVGSAILNELLQRGHKVTAVARNPEKIGASNPNLTVVKADVSSAETVAQLAAGFEVVVSAYNPGWGNANIYADTLAVYPAILAGAKQAGAKRLLCVGGAGSLFCAPGLRVMDAGFLPEEIMPAVRGLAEFYTEILMKETEIDWVFFSPAGNIAPGQRTGVFRLGKDELVVDAAGQSNISVEDYAVAMANEVETPQHHHTRFTIGY